MTVRGYCNDRDADSPVPRRDHVEGRPSVRGLTHRRTGASSQAELSLPPKSDRKDRALPLPSKTPITSFGSILLVAKRRGTSVALRRGDHTTDEARTSRGEDHRAERSRVSQSVTSPALEFRLAPCPGPCCCSCPHPSSQTSPQNYMSVLDRSRSPLRERGTGGPSRQQRPVCPLVSVPVIPSSLDRSDPTGTSHGRHGDRAGTVRSGASLARQKRRPEGFQGEEVAELHGRVGRRYRASRGRVVGGRRHLRFRLF